MNNKFPTEVIELPSEGYFYPESSPLSSGKLELKYMTAREEDILTSKNLIQKGIVIDKLLESLIVTKIDYSELLLGDKNAVLLASRILAYGKDYDVVVTCPKCGESFDTTIDLTTVTNKEVEVLDCVKGTKDFTVELPFSKIKITIKLLTHKDEVNIDAELKALKKISSVDGIDRELTTRLKYLISSVNGDTNPQRINSFVMDELLSRDIVEIKKIIKKTTPDIDTSISSVCHHCSAQFTFDLPININFFWPSSRD